MIARSTIFIVSDRTGITLEGLVRTLLTDEHLVAGMDLQVSYDRETGSRKGSDRYAWFPITRDQLQMLLEDNVCTENDGFARLGLTPTHFGPDALTYLRG